MGGSDHHFQVLREPTVRLECSRKNKLSAMRAILLRRRAVPVPCFGMLGPPEILTRVQIRGKRVAECGCKGCVLDVLMNFTSM